MKLFLKIIFFIFTMIITTVGEAKSSIVIIFSQEEMSISFFQKVESNFSNFKNHSENSCLNGKDVVTYNEQGIGTIKAVAKGGGKELYNFGETATQHMTEPGRKVPLQILDDVIKNTKGLPDPGGSGALMHYSPMWRNGTQYQLEILYNQPTNSIWHFMYYPIKP